MPRIASTSLLTFTGLCALAFAARAQSPAVSGLSQFWVPALGNGLCKYLMLNAYQGSAEVPAPAVSVPTSQPLHLRVAVRPSAKCQFSYSLNDQPFTPLGGA